MPYGSWINDLPTGFVCTLHSRDMHGSVIVQGRPTTSAGTR